MSKIQLQLLFVIFFTALCLSTISHSVFSQIPNNSANDAISNSKTLQSSVNAFESGYLQENVTSEQQESSENKTNSVIEINDEYDPSSSDPWKKLRDIFKPMKLDTNIQSKPKKSQPLIAPKPILKGILITSDNDRIAILNDSFVRVGEVVSDWEVRKITSDKVILKRQEEEIVCELKK